MWRFQPATNVWTQLSTGTDPSAPPASATLWNSATLVSHYGPSNASSVGVTDAVVVLTGDDFNNNLAVTFSQVYAFQFVDQDGTGAWGQRAVTSR